MEDSKFDRIIYWNLGIYFFITFLEIALAKASQPREFYFLILSILTIGFQILMNFALSIYFFVRGNADLGKGFLLSLLLILLIGYPLCFMGFVRIPTLEFFLRR